jgi:hypothetical protein
MRQCNSVYLFARQDDVRIAYFSTATTISTLTLTILAFTTGNTETSVSQRPAEVSPKPTKASFFVSFRLTSVGLWSTEVFRRKLAKFHRPRGADKN